MYRGPDGTKCAIGHLLTDDELVEIAKHVLCGHPESLFVAEIAKAIGVDATILAEIQKCHDLAVIYMAKGIIDEFIPEFQRRMKLLAERHSLAVPSGPGDE